MFDDAGLEYPQDGWTWDQFRETAEKLTKDGVYGFCFPCTYFQLTPWWSTNNAALVGEDGETPTVNSEGIVEAVDFLNGMYKDGICPEQSAQTDILCLQIIRLLWLVLAVGY